VGLYTIRHAFATPLLLTKEPAKVVSERLGRSFVALAPDA
jgi:site-specific recombinase XerD